MKKLIYEALVEMGFAKARALRMAKEAKICRDANGAEMSLGWVEYTHTKNIGLDLGRKEYWPMWSSNNTWKPYAEFKGGAVV
jgi:hypothetical protein